MTVSQIKLLSFASDRLLKRFSDLESLFGSMMRSQPEGRPGVVLPPDDRLEAEPVGGADAQSTNRVVPESSLGAGLD